MSIMDDLMELFPPIPVAPIPTNSELCLDDCCCKCAQRPDCVEIMKDYCYERSMVYHPGFLDEFEDWNLTQHWSGVRYPWEHRIKFWVDTILYYNYKEILARAPGRLQPDNSKCKGRLDFCRGCVYCFVPDDNNILEETCYRNSMNYNPGFEGEFEEWNLIQHWPYASYPREHRVKLWVSTILYYNYNDVFMRAESRRQIGLGTWTATKAAALTAALATFRHGIHLQLDNQYLIDE